MCHFSRLEKVVKSKFAYIIIDIMPDYSEGKIYKIWDNNYSKCYIGSTVQPLSKRMQGHRTAYNRLEKDRTKFSTACLLFDEFGLDGCKIELLELYPCSSKEELHAREGHHQRENECVNKTISGRTYKEYYHDNKEYLIQKVKIYNENNKEHYRQYKKEWCETNKETIANKQKDKYERNKETIREKYRAQYALKKDELNEKRREQYQYKKDDINKKYTCECGSVSCLKSKYRHEKTLKHLQYLQTLEETN